MASLDLGQAESTIRREARWCSAIVDGVIIEVAEDLGRLPTT
jgi:hypothetical protein